MRDRIMSFSDSRSGYTQVTDLPSHCDRGSALRYCTVRDGHTRRPALPRCRFGPVGANRRLEQPAVHVATQHLRVAPERLRASPVRPREDLEQAGGQVALAARGAGLLGTALARRYANSDYGLLSPLRGLLHSHCR